MPTPDPYQRWSGAPKHWVVIPAQRQAPPRALRPLAPSAGTQRAVARTAVMTVAVAVTALLVALAGPGASVADRDDPAPSVTPTGP